MSSRSIKVALVGNPNSGKSTLFNVLTGLNQKVANFAGVTVEKKTGFSSLQNNSGEKIKAQVIDLPGTYSLYGQSPDEQIPFQVLCNSHDPDFPDVTLVIADASNLKRSLLLCSQVIDLQVPVILVLNMMDLVHQQGSKINIQNLSSSLGIPVIPLSARKEEGIEALKKEIVLLQKPAKRLVKIEEKMSVIATEQEEQQEISYASFLLLCNNNESIYIELEPSELKKLQAEETLERYQLISEIISHSVITIQTQKKAFTEKVDRFLTHKVYGYILFLLVMFLMFQAIFSWSSLPMDTIEFGFLSLSNYLREVLPAGVFADLLTNGIITGLSGIAIFIPQIALLFFFIAILEDTGYMARVSFIMDKMMHKFGLNGKSVIPLLSGIACAVPAIMSARTIQNKRERLITILITPLMSCSARIPIYTLIVSMIIPTAYIGGVINLQGLVLLGLYLIGFIVAIGSSLLMKLLIKSRERSFFIMELPVYRAPRWKNIVITIAQKVKYFVLDAGKIIIAISIVLWFLASYGPPSPKADPSLSSSIGRVDNLSDSYAGKMGHWMEPVIQPLGFDWKIGISLITSFAAREVFVGTMATIYGAGEENSEKTLKEKMLSDINPDTGLPVYTFATGMSLLLFYAFAMQCMSTLAVVYRETKTWKWPFVQMTYMGALAYLSSFIVFQLLK